MLWIRGLIFTALVPTVVAYILPLAVDPGAHLRRGLWSLGWLSIAAGVMIYVLCLFRFLAAEGTPNIFFARPLRFLVGEEPPRLVSSGLYRYSRNPMYVGVLTALCGEAIVFASLRIAMYAGAVCLFFYLIVVLVEEPHLRAARGPAYESYCRDVPRWLGRPRRRRS